MAILDIFKKKKKERPAKKPVKESVKEIPTPVKEKKVKEKRTGAAWRILKSPHITEKATELVKQNQYSFKVLPGTNKTEMKEAIESLYGVDVLGVRIVKARPKRRRLGKISGWKKGYKKAIVKIKEGQKIEVLPR